VSPYTGRHHPPQPGRFDRCYGHPPTNHPPIVERCTPTETGHEPPSPAELADGQRRAGPPDNKAPGALAWAAVFGRGPGLAVLLTGAAAYSTGLRLEVAVRAREGFRGGELFHAVHGHGGTRRDRLLLGVEYADGRVASTRCSARVGRAGAAVGAGGRLLACSSLREVVADRGLIRLAPALRGGDVQLGRVLELGRRGARDVPR
jgi:hypothetical protein